METLAEATTRRFLYSRAFEVAKGKVTPTVAKARALELQICRDSISHWVQQWVFTYDPRPPIKGQLFIPYLPFTLFPIQEKFLEWLQEREDKQERGLVEKSRDMGASFIACAKAVHKWLFFPGYRVGFGSNLERNVDDKGNPKSLFQKLRQMLYRLPNWMLPRKFDPDKHDNMFKLINPDTDAAITGDVGPRIGRGDRTGIYFIDEAADLDDPDVIDGNMIAVTRVRIDISTPQGMGNNFARLRFSGNVPVFTMHYRDDPRKTPELIAQIKRETNNEVIWAREYEIDYSASLEGIAIPAKWVRAAIDLLPVPDHGPLIGGFDIAGEGANTSVMAFRRGSVILPEINEWQGVNPFQVASHAKDVAEARGAAEVVFDANGIGANVSGQWAASGTRFTATGIDAGGKATEEYWDDGRMSREKFINRRAEMWWKVRTRFERAYEHKEGLCRHNPEDMISIPNNPRLIQELSLPMIEHNDRGKLQIEGKRKMRSRGISSPDYADAVILSFVGYGNDWQAGPVDTSQHLMKNIPSAVPTIAGPMDEDHELCMSDLIQRMGM